MRKVKKKKVKKSDLDWDAMKEEFFTDLNQDGTYRYVNVEEFGRHIARGNSELYKKVVRSIRHRAYRGYEWQGDWAAERLKEASIDDAKVKSLRKKIDQEYDLLEVGKDVAETYVPLQCRIDRLFVELDEIYGGKAVLVEQQIQPPSTKYLKKRHMTMDQYLEEAKLRREIVASRRFKDYMRCMSQILRFKRAVDQQLLDCLGWNRPQFIGMIASLSRKGHSTGVTTTKVESVMLDLARAQLKKAEMYDMELPEDFKHVTKLLGNGNGTSHRETDEEAIAVAKAIPVSSRTSRNGHGRNGSKR